MNDFNSSLESAQKNPKDFSLAPPPSEQEKERVKKFEEQLALQEQNLRLESEQEALQDERKQAEFENQEKMQNWNKKKWLFLSLCFVGHSPKAPGTFGSLVGVLLGLPILYYLHASNLIMLAILLGLFGVKWTNEYEAAGGIHDDKRIVIDELVGVWITLAMLGFGMLQALLAFALFRLFDIWKPSIIGRIDRDVKGGLGVMGDDVVAGFFAGLLGLIVLGILNQFGLWELPLDIETIKEIPQND